MPTKGVPFTDLKSQTWPQVQLALDLVHTRDALRIARLAVSQGIGWLEAGTPLIKSEGMNAVRLLVRRFPGRVVVADMKTLDAGAIETEMALQAGAGVVSVSGLAHDRTIRDSVRIATRYDRVLMADLLMAINPQRRAMQLQSLGADIVCVHTGIDAQKALRSRLKTNRTILDLTRSLRIPVATAGGIDPGLSASLVEAGVKLIVVGGWITGSRDPANAARQVMDKIRSVSRADDFVS